MRFVMAPGLRVSAILVLACLVLAVTGQQLLRDGDHEFAVVHRNHPNRVRKVDLGQPAHPDSVYESVKEFEHENHVGVEREDEKPKLQWKFNALKPWKTFEVSKERHHHGHKKCGMAAKLRSWIPSLFGYRWFHHHDDEHRREELGSRPFMRFGRSWLPWGRHSDRHEHHHHRHVEGMDHDSESRFVEHREGLVAKIGGFFSGVWEQMKNWGMPVRKAPTLQAATEPLDMHALHSSGRLASPTSGCYLRQELYTVIISVLKEVAAIADSNYTDLSHSKSTYSDVKSNLKMLMGDSMKQRIFDDICGATSMSSCKQEFCDVFLSHPKSGILMAFHILSISPLRAAINPGGVANCLPPYCSRHERLTMSQSGMDMLMKVKEIRKLEHKVIADMDQVSLDNPEMSAPVMEHKQNNHHWWRHEEVFHVETTPCRACLRQEIFRMKRLAKWALAAACEQPVAPWLKLSCKIVEENKFVAKTMFLYKFRIWEKAALICRSQKACSSLPASSVKSTEVGGFDTGTMKLEGRELSFPHLDVNAIRRPRFTGPLNSRRKNCKQHALHRAGMLRGNSFEFLTSQLMKAGERLSQHTEIGPVLVVEISNQPDFQFSPEELSHMLSLITDSLDVASDTPSFHPEISHLKELEPFRGFFRNPVFDQNPGHTDWEIPSLITVPEESQNVAIPVQGSTEHLSGWTGGVLEQPAVKVADAEHADM